LRCIAGLERIQGGRIVFDGRDITDSPVQGRNMSMIFQTFALYPHLTVYDNLAYPLREARIDRAETARRVGEIAEMLRITHTLKRKPGTLSGGEQQRLAIGRALIRRPALLLLDEPLTNLDAKLRHDTRAEFKRLHRDLGMTMVYATPDQLEALTMGQRIAVLRQGRVVQIDTPEALYTGPANDYVATLVGAPPMNLIGGKVGRNGAGPIIELPFMDVTVGDWAGLLAATPPGTEILFGVRPHDLAPVQGERRGPAFSSKVHLIEPLGGVTVIDLEARDQILKMVLPEEEALAYPVGREVDVEISLPDTHLFYRDSGVAIW
jgi:multiple sugar transport system ATP-binding protein